MKNNYMELSEHNNIHEGICDECERRGDVYDVTFKERREGLIYEGELCANCLNQIVHENENYHEEYSSYWDGE
ncbi:MAG: hypothetical protein ACOCQD_03865 [archaeon]